MRKISFWILILVFTVTLARAQDAATQQQLDKVLTDYQHASTDNAPEPSTAEISDETREQLEGLGYVNKK